MTQGVFLAVLFIVVVGASLPKLQVYTVDGPGQNRVLAQEGTKPFFWTGATAWTLFHSLEPSDVSKYLDDRILKGFNVIQAAALSMEDVHKPNVNGDWAFTDKNHDDPTQPNPKFFNHVVDVVDEAASKNLYVALWAQWGSIFVSGGKVIFNPVNAYTYGKYLGELLANRTNVVFVLGGDTPFPLSDSSIVVYRMMAEGIAQGFVGGPRPKWNDTTNPIWKKLLMTYHPASGHSSSEMFNKDAWLSFNLIQSGWRRYDMIEPLISKDYEMEPTRPTFMGEGAYEMDIYTYCGMPYYNDQWGVRLNAYWSVFAGGFGYTYGANAIFNFANPGTARSVGFTWQTALDFPGASQLKYLNNLIMSRDWIKLVPDTHRTFVPSSGDVKKCDLTIGTYAVDGSFGFVYSTRGNSFNVNLSVIKSKEVNVVWLDPRTGNKISLGVVSNSGLTQFTPLASYDNPENDWVLIVEGTGGQ